MQFGNVQYVSSTQPQQYPSMQGLNTIQTRLISSQFPQSNVSNIGFPNQNPAYSVQISPTDAFTVSGQRSNLVSNTAQVAQSSMIVVPSTQSVSTPGLPIQSNIAQTGFVPIPATHPTSFPFSTTQTHAVSVPSSYPAQYVVYGGGQPQIAPSSFQAQPVSFQQGTGYSVAPPMLGFPTHAWRLTDAEIQTMQTDVETQVRGRNARPPASIAPLGNQPA